MNTSANMLANQDLGSPGRHGSGWLAIQINRAMNAVPPPGLVLLAIVSIQVGAALAIQLFATLGAAGTVFLRVAISSLLLLVVLRPSFNRSRWRHAWLLLLYGLVLAVMNLCFYQAIARIPLGTAVAIEFLGPLGVALATSRRPIDLLWVALAFAGLALLAPEIGQSLDVMGVVFAAVAGLGWGSFILISRRIARIFPGGSGLAMGMTLAALFLAPFGLLDSAPVLFDPLLLLAVTAVAVLSTTIPFTLEFEALKRMPPRTYGVLVTLEPVVAVLIGAALLADRLGLEELAAVACITLAAIGATMVRKEGF